MTAPPFVPGAADRRHRWYRSPPQRTGGWSADRPGEVVADGHQPRGEALGNQGPDQGFAITLAERALDDERLDAHEHREDALAGVVAVAMRRASLLTRGPTMHDVRHALAVFGLLDPAPAEMVAWRRETLAGLGHGPAHYLTARSVAAAVPAEVLALSPDAARDAHRTDWRSTVGA